MRRSDLSTHEQNLAAYAEWEWHYRQVEAFVRERGHCHLGEHPAGDWLRAQVQVSTAGRLSQERQERLARLGVSLDPGDAAWEAMLQRVREVLIRRQVPRRKGRVRWLPEPMEGDPAAWLREQRALEKVQMLRPDRLRKLQGLMLVGQVCDSAGAKSSPHAASSDSDIRWETRFAELTAFHQLTGNCDVPKHWAENRTLANWVSMQRQLQRDGKLSPARRERLDALGFSWRPGKLPLLRLWEHRYAQLCAFAEQHGHTRVPKSFDRQLWHWRHVQREFRRKGMLKPDRIALLDDIGFEWEEHGVPWAKSREERWDRQWDSMYAQLVEFQRQHGSTHVVTRWPENPSLATWVGDQRERERHGGLRPDRKERLDAIGFQWSPGRPTLATLWEKRYAELVAFKDRHGHTRVPKSFDRQLWHWRHVQREFRRKGMLKPDRIALLDDIGFEWEERGQPGAKSREERWDRQWDTMYEQLVEFQRQHGTTHVVAGWPENPRLATWVGDQRENERHGGLRPDRKERLNAIGFQWSPGRPSFAAIWEQRYAQIAAFKEEHGHTRALKSFDKQLRNWRHAQREFRKKGMLSPERIARLDAIGFEWSK